MWRPLDAATSHTRYCNPSRELRPLTLPPSPPRLLLPMSVNIVQLHEEPLETLRQKADEAGIADSTSYRRHDLIFEIARAMGQRGGTLLGRGVLEVHGEGFGFLRSAVDNFLPGNDDIYVSQSQIRRFKLQTGDTVIGMVRPPKDGERYTALLRVESVNGEGPGQTSPSFDELTAIHPDDRLRLGAHPLLRPIEALAPLALGHRGLLVAPPDSGGNEVLSAMVEAATADDELAVTVLLVAAAPEDIREWRTSTTAEVISTPYDEPQGRHLQVAEIVFERARRMVEHGDDVVLFVDSLTRLARACLAEVPPAGRAVDGIDVAALNRLRRHLGAARALEEGGSLTVIGVLPGTDDPIARALAADLAEVLSWRVDLSADLARRGLRPAIDVDRTGARRADKVHDRDTLELVASWRAQRTGDRVEDAVRLLELTRGTPKLDSVATTGQ